MICLKQAIPITAKHIRTGQANSCKYCPIALALSDFFRYVFVGRLYTTIEADDHIINRLPYDFGEDVSLWIDRFDNREDVKPFVLILNHKARTAEMMEADASEEL